MAIKISKNIGLTDIVVLGNEIITQHINTGESKQVLVYLFNDAASKRYENVIISAIDTEGTSEASWLQFAPNNSGSPGAFSNTLNMANISDNNVAKPFWVRVTNTNVQDSMNKSDLKIQVAANEFAV